MSNIEELDEYSNDLIRLIKNKSTEQNFQKLAIRLYDLQKHSRVYGKLASGSVTSWEEIPCIPISIYKHAKVVAYTPEDEVAIACYRSSGTTQANRSMHYVLKKEPYRTASRWGYFNAVHTDAESQVYGLSAPLNVQESSLIAMMQFVINRHVQTDFSEESIEQFRKNLFISAELEETSLFGTTLALNDVAMMSAEDIPLNNLIVVETGGMKGRDFGSLTSRDLSENIRHSFGCSRVMREYGMSELSSQLYGEVREDSDVVEYSAVPWLKYRIVNPTTGEEVSKGEEGLIQFYDLANVWSCGFVQTEDMGRITDDNKLILLGRAKGAAEKGCGMTFAQAMEKIND